MPQSGTSPLRICFDAPCGAVVRVKTLTLDPSDQRCSSQERVTTWEEPVTGSLSGLLFSIDSSLANPHGTLLLPLRYKKIRLSKTVVKGGRS